MEAWTACRGVSTAEQMNPANRQTMEDESSAIDCFNGDPSQAYFAVYDGHGGE